MQAVAAQQLEADVRAGIAEAAKLTDKAEAVKRYKGLLGRVEADKNLPDDRRAALKRVLQDRIRLAETSGRRRTAGPKAARSSPKAPRRSRPRRRPGRHRQDQGSDRRHRHAESPGQTGRGPAQGRELLQKNPDNVGVQVLNGISASANGLAEAAVGPQRNRRTGGVAMRDVDKIGHGRRSATLNSAAERKLVRANGCKRYGQSAEDKAILEALAAPIKVEFKSDSLPGRDGLLVKRR